MAARIPQSHPVHSAPIVTGRLPTAISVTNIYKIIFTSELHLLITLRVIVCIDNATYEP